MQEMGVWFLDQEDPWVGIGTSLQYSCLENSMGRETWQAIVHVATKSGTWLDDWIHTHDVIYFIAQIIPVLAIGNSFKLVMSLWSISILPFLNISFSLALWDDLGLSFFFFFHPDPRISYFSKDPWYLFTGK